MNCPVCRTVIDQGFYVACPRCVTPHHNECWRYNDNQCAIFGCQHFTPPPKQVNYFALAVCLLPAAILIVLAMELMVLFFANNFVSLLRIIPLP